MHRNNSDSEIWGFSSRVNCEAEGDEETDMTVSVSTMPVTQSSANVSDGSVSPAAVKCSSEEQHSPSLMLPIPKKSRTIKTDKPRPFLCPICTRGFVRQEHLKRHQRSHTNEKPFLCVFCGRCFARRDLVLRHQHKLHAALVSKTLEDDMEFSDTRENNSNNNYNESVDRNIIKVDGNKESILPTPSNPLAKTTAELRKAAKQAAMGASLPIAGNSNGIKGQIPQKRQRKRHASFSASSAFSYVNDSSSSLLVNKEMELQEGPHQVGFSTPQLTAQELMDKVIQSGVVDVSLLGLPPDLGLNDDSHMSPLTNVFTSGSGGGAGGFARLDASNDSNLMLFQPEDFLNSQFSREHQAQRDHQNYENFKECNDYHGCQGQYNFFQDIHQWSPDFISNTQSQPDFNIDMEHLNDIGFTDAIPTTSEALHSDIYNLSLQHHKDAKDNIRLAESPALSSNSNQSAESNNTSNGISLGHSISALFKWRQKDLFDEPYPSISSPKSTSPGPPPDLRETSCYYRKCSKLFLFEEEYRSNIIADNDISSKPFPTVDELNSYLNFYLYEFHRYFPFIHLHSLVPSMDTYPLLLSISMIGALYAFHSSHAMLLSNISWRYLKNHLENLKGNYNSVPLWLIQTMVLLSFLGIFSNDSCISRSMKPRIRTMINLVKITKLNLPLENFENPPIESDHVYDNHDNPGMLSQIRARYNNPEQDKKNFEYFVKAQARVRTCHTILLISNLFNSLVGFDCNFPSIDLKCGVPCYYEDLYLCENVNDWSELLKKYRIILDSKFSLIHLANGCEDYENCLMYISTGSQYYFENSKVSFRTLLSMLISVHEKISMEGLKFNNEDNLSAIEVKWGITSRPIIESMLKCWEAIYIKNDGILTINRTNITVVSECPSMRLIIPLHLFANIRKCINVCPIMNKAWIKDWENMNKVVDNLCFDIASLREATGYALRIIDFWIVTVSVKANVRRTALRTPIFSITCMFSSILIISEYMKRIEASAQHFEMSNPHSPIINAFDRLLWLKSEEIFQKVEKHLLPKGYNLQSYSEFLRIQAKGALDVEVLDNLLAQRAMHPDTSLTETAAVITRARLSTRCLYLGVRILGDEPIWPIALLFAHTLQARAIYNEDKKF